MNLRSKTLIIGNADSAGNDLSFRLADFFAPVKLAGGLLTRWLLR